MPASGEPTTVATVTARYETEDLQKTPIAISTTSSDQLQSANVTSMNNLGQLVPNLYTASGRCGRERRADHRHARCQPGRLASYARAPAVAMYIDDVYRTRRPSAPSST